MAERTMKLSGVAVAKCFLCGLIFCREERIPTHMMGSMARRFHAYPCHICPGRPLPSGSDVDAHLLRGAA